tara:strand:+ start:1257 stop:4691 length:3435 start_codon:yes stop_codon:yes gene_type:complete
MKKRIGIFLAVLLSSLVSAQQIEFNSEINDVVLTANAEHYFEVFSGIQTIESIDVNTSEGVFTKLILPGYVHSKEFGKPELPQIQKLIEIPLGANIKTELLAYEKQTLLLSDYGIENPLIPSQPSISKEEDAASVPFKYYPEVYQLNEFLGKEIVTVEPLGLLRGVQMARLTIAPFKYNPVTNELIVFNNLEVQVKFGDADYEETVIKKQKYYSPAFNPSYLELLNYKPVAKDVITTYPIKYVIVSDPMFQSDLQGFVEWKTKKGFTVVEAYTNDPAVGNTTTSIKAYLEGLYNAGSPSDPAPSYVLFVGDVAQVPSFSGNTGWHVSDLYYCTYDGPTDIYPDMYYGRFSATNSSQLMPQIEKTLMFEEYTFPDPSYLDEVLLVAGVDAGMAPTYGNGQINYGTDNYFNAAHGITSHIYLYGSGSPVTSDQSIASGLIIDDVNNGVGFANYTAHCFEQGWADPSFESSDVLGLTNENEYCVIVSNCCLPNAFDNAECFGEAILRAHGKGAVGHIGGSNNTYWNEDYWWAVGTGSISANPTYIQTGLGVFDCLFHENGEPVSDWFVSLSQMVHSGNLAVTAAGGSEDYYWEIYHVMGDPSLMPYMSVPDPMTVTHLTTTPLGSSTLNVSAEEHAYVAVSQNGILLDAQLVGASGNVTMSFAPLASMGVLDVVVTKQDRQPYIGNVQVISTNAPFVTAISYQIDDTAANNNQLADFNEQFYLDVDFQNLGSINASGVTATLTSSDPNVNIIDGLENLNTITSSTTINAIGAYELAIVDGVQDQHLVVMDVAITDNASNIWNAPINLVVNAPELKIGGFELIDASGNGILEPGETATINIESFNDGSADCGSTDAILSTLNMYVNITSSTYNFISLPQGGTIQQASFTIQADANIPYATAVTFDYDLSFGLYNAQESFDIIANMASEDYETGNMLQYDWSVSGNAPWLIVGTGQFEGDHCAKSGPIGNNQVSTMELELNVAVPGDLSFYKKVSTENGYDYLQFYIDNTLRDEWSGVIDWSKESYWLTPGVHTLKWEYVKDGWVDENDDCAWVDYILFPQLVSSTEIEEQLTFNIQITPNPASDQCSIHFDKIVDARVQLYDTQGRLLLEKNTAGESIFLNLTNFAAGVYYLEVYSGKDKIVEKLVIK